MTAAGSHCWVGLLFSVRLPRCVIVTAWVSPCMDLPMYGSGSKLALFMAAEDSRLYTPVG